MAEIRKNLGDILIDEGVLSREELDDALEKSRARELSLEDTLFKLGYISRDRLGGLLAKIHECEFIDLYSCKVDSEAIAAISPDQAIELRALPYALDGNTLSVALSGDSIEDRPIGEITRRLERLSGKKIRICLCNPGPLNEMLLRFCQPEPKGAPPAGSSQGELATVIHLLKSDHVEITLRGQFEELYDIGQTALIGARSHPFSRAVATTIEEAKSKLAESRKYVGSGFEEEAIEMAKQAVALIKEATARANSFEKDWEKLLQEVKRLRGKITALESEGAAEYASAEFKELTEIRESLLECVNERNVDKLRSLLDQGMVITEKVSLLEPGRSRGREQVIASLAQVREVIARARNSGAKEHAPDALKEAYDYLDQAEAYARHAQWDEVRECLSSAESHAVEAERVAVQAAKEKEHLTIKLRESIRTAMSLFEEAITHTFAHEVIENLMRAKDVINETKACFESDELERGIGLGQNVARRIRDEIIPLADEAQRLWSELYARANSVSAQTQAIDIPLALKISPEKMKLLFRNEREMVSALCERDRGKLAEAVSICEGLADEIRRRLAAAQDSLRDVESVLEEVDALLASTAASGIDEEVAPAYDGARRLVEEARGFFEGGDADEALSRAQAARVKLESEVIEPRDAAQREWNELSLKAIEVSERIQSMNIPLVLRVAPEKMEILFQKERDMVGSLSERDRDRLAEAVSVCEGLADEIRRQITGAKEGLRLAEAGIEDATRFLATAAASGIDEKVAPAYDESRRLLEEAKNLFERGDAEGAFDRAETARIKLETEVIESQDSVRQAWRELSQRAIGAFVKIQSVDVPIALKTIPEKMELLFEGQRDMARALCERDREKLAEAISACEGLSEEIAQTASAAQDGLRRADVAIRDAEALLASAAETGIDEKVAPAYAEAGRILSEARNLLEFGNADVALERAQTARAKLEAEVVEPQNMAREKWIELSPRAKELLDKTERACSADAMRFCPDLVRTLRINAVGIVSAVTTRDMEGLESAVNEVGKDLESLSGAIEAVKEECHKDLSAQLAEVEEAVQTAVQRCAGNYSPDMLEAAYLDLNRIKDSLVEGPEALTAELDNQLTRDLAVARTKVWQVEFIRERIEREREENLNQLRLKLDSARESIDACAGLDFVGESSPLIQKARSLLEQVDSLIIEGDIEEGFECIRRSDALADQSRTEAEEKEAEWRGVAERLGAEDSPHRTALAEPAAQKVAGEEFNKLSEIDAQTRATIDSKDLDALKRHADELAQLAEAVRTRLDTWRKETGARIEEKLQDARREIGLANLLGATGACADVLNAASTFADIARTYLDRHDFENADPAADDALAKAREAGKLAKTNSQRESSLAIEYMKIAAAHIAQQNPEAAREALQRGLSLAKSAGGKGDEPADAEASPAPDTP